jgi:hypothetical protein
MAACGMQLKRVPQKDKRRMFCLDPARRRLDDLGCAVSVIQRRRYGYQFAAAMTGRDGEILFGEDDDFGHLWLYFPRIDGPPRA